MNRFPTLLLCTVLFSIAGASSADAVGIAGDDPSTAGVIPIDPGAQVTTFSDSDNTSGASDALQGPVGEPTLCSYEFGSHPNVFVGPDKWYTFTLSVPSRVSARLASRQPVEENWESVLAIFDSDGTLVTADRSEGQPYWCPLFDCNDTNWPPDYPIAQPFIEGCVLPAGTYTLSVDSYFWFGPTFEGPYDLSVEIVKVGFGGEDPSSAGVIPFSCDTPYYDIDTTEGASNFVDSVVPTQPFCDFGFFAPSFAAPDKWYTFTLPTDVAVTAFTDLSTSFDAGMGIYDENLELVAVAEDGQGTLQPFIDACQLSAGTYYLNVDGFGSGESGRYGLHVSISGGVCEPVRPANDDCASAEAIGPGTVTFDTTDALGTPDADYPLGVSPPDVWYAFTADRDGDVRFSTEGSAFDTVLIVYIGDCSQPEMIGYDDDGGPGRTSVIDRPVVSGTRYLIRVRGYSESDVGPGVLTIESRGATHAPASSGARLHAAIPNPFNPRTTIRFDLPAPTTVRLTVYDVGGRLVKTLVRDSVSAGRHEAVWQGDDDAGRSVASGVYFYRLEAGSFVESRRMTLLE